MEWKLIWTKEKIKLVGGLPLIISLDHGIMMIFSGKKHNFEGVELPIPANYDVYLKKIYGDYMKCPPEAERRARNKIVNVSFSEQLETERL